MAANYIRKSAFLISISFQFQHFFGHFSNKPKQRQNTSIDHAPRMDISSYVLDQLHLGRDSSKILFKLNISQSQI